MRVIVLGLGWTQSGSDEDEVQVHEPIVPRAHAPYTTRLSRKRRVYTIHAPRSLPACPAHTPPDGAAPLISAGRADGYQSQKQFGMKNKPKIWSGCIFRLCFVIPKHHNGSK